MRKGFALPLVLFSVLVLMSTAMAYALRREDLAGLADRALARLELSNYLASAADECWWEACANAAPARRGQGPSLHAVFARPDPRPQTWRQSVDAALTRDRLPAASGMRLAPATLSVRAWNETGALPQGVVELVVAGSHPLKRGRLSLAVHQLRRFWVYALPRARGGASRLVGGPMYTQEILAQWVEEVR